MLRIVFGAIRRQGFTKVTRCERCMQWPSNIQNADLSGPFRILSRRTIHHIPIVKGEKDRQASHDTIYALSTASGRAAIAIVRISGPSCGSIYHQLCPGKPLPNPRHAALRTIYDPSASDPSLILDSNALVLSFPAPNTVTGEDVLELHIHGGPATVKAVLAAISRCGSRESIRYAEPGEFTKRAFTNRRLDLAQVEALRDTLSAETEQQRRGAVYGTSGKIGRTYESWRQLLLQGRGELEALIDFSEDQHFDESPTEFMSNVTSQIEGIMKMVTEHDRASKCGELLRRGIRVSLLGPPNAGKSSLLNYIVGREASIVSQEPGTTRDVVEASLDMHGYLCTFADTAGLRSPGSSNYPASPIGLVEQEGMRRAKAKAKEADVVIILASIERDLGHRHGWKIQYDPESLTIAAKTEHALLVLNKIDHVSTSILHSLMGDFSDVVEEKMGAHSAILPVSCKTAHGASTDLADRMNHFVAQLVSKFSSMTSLPEDLADFLGVTERQRQLLATCSQHLSDYLEEVRSADEGECDIVLAAEHLRSAANCLSRITGRGDAGDVEEVLGVVFEKCVLVHLHVTEVPPMVCHY